MLETKSISSCLLGKPLCLEVTLRPLELLWICNWASPLVCTMHMSHNTLNPTNCKKNQRRGWGTIWHDYIYFCSFLVYNWICACKGHGCNLLGCYGMGLMLLKVGGSGILTELSRLSLIMPPLRSRNISQWSRVFPGQGKVCISWKIVNKEKTHGDRTSNQMHGACYMPIVSAHVHPRRHGVHTFLFMFPRFPTFIDLHI